MKIKRTGIHYYHVNTVDDIHELVTFATEVSHNVVAQISPTQELTMNLLQDLGGLATLEPATFDFDTAELESLRIRTELMLTLRCYIQERQWTLDEAAHAFRQSSPRMQNLINGEISRFSVEDLVQLLARVGLTVNVSVSVPATSQR